MARMHSRSQNQRKFQNFKFLGAYCAPPSYPNLLLLTQPLNTPFPFLSYVSPSLEPIYSLPQPKSHPPFRVTERTEMATDTMNGMLLYEEGSGE